MADTYGPIIVELEYYDGPASGLAVVDGVIHYFDRVVSDSYVEDEEYHVWPASPEIVALERESWAIFIDWITRYEAGTASIDEHPARAGVNARRDELQARLKSHRVPPPDACLTTAEFRRIDREERYTLAGAAWEVRFRSLAKVLPEPTSSPYSATHEDLSRSSGGVAGSGTSGSSDRASRGDLGGSAQHPGPVHRRREW